MGVGRNFHFYSEEGVPFRGRFGLRLIQNSCCMYPFLCIIVWIAFSQFWLKEYDEDDEEDACTCPVQKNQLDPFRRLTKTHQGYRHAHATYRISRPIVPTVGCHQKNILQQRNPILWRKRPVSDQEIKLVLASLWQIRSCFNHCNINGREPVDSDVYLEF